ncbi:MAG: response regulator [Chloroflexota bacterium]
MITILVVDDNEQNLYMLQALFQGHGYRVVTAYNGAEALQLAQHTPPELIISDILMPIMDGFALCRQWMNNAHLKQLPFIFYTATYTDTKDEAFGLSLGATAYLIKPVDPELLVKKIDDILNGRNSSNDAEEISKKLDEEEVYKLYNERLVNKLEKKMFQLEQEVKEREQAEAQLKQSNKLLVDAIAELKETQKQIVRQERLAAIGQLATGIAHDFNNILSVISLQTELQKRVYQSEEKGSHRLDLVLNQVDQASQLINQVLDFSLQTTLVKRPTDLFKILTQTTELLKRTLPENIEIEFQSLPIQYVVFADRTRINQIMMNLAFNARDAMPLGGKLTITLKKLQHVSPNSAPIPHLPLGAWVAILVSDQGVGIPSKIQPRLFEPFFTTKPPGKGTGLGLAQVYGIIQQHSGYIDVQSQENVGTTFSIYLPLTLTRPDESIQIGQESIPTGQGESVLVVEDNETMLQTIVTSLELLNYRPLQATNGAEALILLKEHPPVDLILSDVYMPEIDGTALVDALTDENIPVILMTGYGVPKLNELKEEGAIVDWVSKPLTFNRLAKAIAFGLNHPNKEL